jgi:hypothetical protein
VVSTDAILKLVAAVTIAGVSGLVAITIVIVTAVLRSNARPRDPAAAAVRPAATGRHRRRAILRRRDILGR